MHSSAHDWDGSWLIGPLLILPALAYISYWHSVNGAFLDRAERTEAMVVRVEQREERSRYGTETRPVSHVRFRDERGFVVDGELPLTVPDSREGLVVDVYYDPLQAELKLAGWRGVYGGLYGALGVIGAALVAMLIAWQGARRRTGPPA